MPRPINKRTKLHDRAPRPRAHQTEDDGDFTMGDSTGEAGPSGAQREEVELEAERTSARPPTKQKKADKLFAKHEALLAKITAGRTPYSKSKSHERRLKRAKKPENKLVTSLGVVEEALPAIEAEEEEDVGQGGELEKVANGKGKEKLTVRKRSRVLEEESTRLPAVMSNPAFAKDPFATIRLHTLNTMKQMEKVNPKKLKGKSK